MDAIEARKLAFQQRVAEGQAARREDKAPVASTIDPDSLTATVGRGTSGAAESLGRSAQVVGRLTGSEGLQDWGKETADLGVSHYKRFGEAPVTSSEDVESFGDLGNYLQETVGGGLISTAPVIVAGIVPAMFKLYKPAAALAGLTGAVFNLGGVDKAMEAADKTENHDLASLATTAVMAPLDMLGMGAIFAPALKQQGKEVLTATLLKEGIAPSVVKEIVGTAEKVGFAKSTFRGAAIESGVGVAQQGIQMSGVAEATDTPIPENAKYQLLDAGVAGFGAGGVAGGAVQSMSGLGAAAETMATPVRDYITDKIQNSKTMEILGVASTARLKPIAKDSESIQAFVDMAVPDQTGKRASGKTLVEQTSLNVGKNMSNLEQAGFMAMSKEQRAKERDAYSQGLRETPSQIALAELYGDIRTRAIENDIEMGEIPNYFSGKTDLNKIRNNRIEFLNDIAPFVANPENVLQGYEKAIQEMGENDGMTPRVDRNLLEEKDGEYKVKEVAQRHNKDDQLRYKVAQGGILPKNHQLEGTRYFKDVPQHIMNKWTKDVDPLVDVRDYVEAAEHRIAVAKNWGLNGEKVNFLLAKASAELAAKGKKLPKGTVDRIYDIMDAHNGVHNLIKDQKVRKTVAAVQTVANISKLPLSGVSSVIEGLLPAIQGELTTTVRGIFPMVQQNVSNMIQGVMKTIPKSEQAKVAAELNITYSAAINTMAERTNDAMLTKNLATASKWFFQANGQTPLVHAFSVGAAIQGNQIIKRNLLALSSGLPFDSQKAVYYSNQLRTLGIDIQTREQAMELYAPQSESQKAFAKDKFNTGTLRFVNNSHLKPDAFNTSMWMNDGQWRMFAGLKRYASTLTNTLMPQMARKFNPNYTGGGAHGVGAILSLGSVMASMMVLGAAQDEVKRYMKGIGNKEDKRTLEQKWLDIAGLAFLPLPATFMRDLWGAAQYGSSPVDAIAGPVVGLANDTMKNIHKLQEDPTKGNIFKFFLEYTPAKPFHNWYDE